MYVILDNEDMTVMPRGHETIEKAQLEVEYMSKEMAKYGIKTDFKVFYVTPYEADYDFKATKEQDEIFDYMLALAKSLKGEKE